MLVERQPDRTVRTGSGNKTVALRRERRPHRAVCYRCFKPRIACICGSIEQVANRTGILILQHPKERFHAVGTERIARLGLANVRVELCAPWVKRIALREQIREGTALLYPAPGALPLDALVREERPRHLVIIDGTWFHAKKIYEAHAWLRQLPAVGLTPSEPSRYRIRREPRSGYVATIEAIVHALRLLEPDTAGLDGLLASFNAMIDRQASYMEKSALRRNRACSVDEVAFPH